MTYGLKTNNLNGDRVIDPSVFTVRLVKVLSVNYGQMAPNSIIEIPEPSARHGMFVQLSSLFSYPVNQILGIPKENGGVVYSKVYADTIPSLPFGSVSDGIITLTAPANRGGGILAHCTLYLLANS